MRTTMMLTVRILILSLCPRPHLQVCLHRLRKMNPPLRPQVVGTRLVIIGPYGESVLVYLPSTEVWCLQSCNSAVCQGYYYCKSFKLPMKNRLNTWLLSKFNSDSTSSTVYHKYLTMKFDRFCCCCPCSWRRRRWHHLALNYRTILYGW